MGKNLQVIAASKTPNFEQARGLGLVAVAVATWCEQAKGLELMGVEVPSIVDRRGRSGVRTVHNYRTCVCRCLCWSGRYVGVMVTLRDDDCAVHLPIEDMRLAQDGIMSMQQYAPDNSNCNPDTKGPWMPTTLQ